MFKLKGWAGVKWGAARRRESEKKSFLNIVENYFLWTVLRVDILCWSSLIITSAIYNQNTQRASSDQLICWLWPQLSSASCTVYVCVCVCLFAVCHLRLGWLGTGPWQGWGETLWGWGDRTHAHVPTLSYTHLHAAFFFFRFCTQAHTHRKISAVQTWKCTWAHMRA